MLDRADEIAVELARRGVTAENLAGRIADCVNEIDDRIRVREFVRGELSWVDRLVAAGAARLADSKGDSGGV
jgi:hypothetical protein